MFKPILIAFLLIVCGGVAAGAEGGEYMLLRGNGSDAGGVRYNRFLPERAFAPQRGGEIAATIRMSPPSARVGRESGFFEWKNHCAIQPPVVEGTALHLAWTPGFLQVTPYASRPPTSGGGFFEALMPD